jgi:anti-sigma regulatory factor (Ser/Thr protein kinase)
MLTKEDRSVVLKAPADIAIEPPQSFMDNLAQTIQERPSAVELDCSVFEQTVSQHIKFLWEVKTVCEEANIPLVLTEVTGSLIRVLKVLDLYHLFQIDKVITEEHDAVAHQPALKDLHDTTIIFAPTCSGISNAMTEFRSFITPLNLSEKIITELETVFYETATNIRVHSGLPNNARVTFKLRIEGDKALLQFEDEGKPFDPSAYPVDFEPTEAINKGQKRGYGLTLIHRMTESMSYERRHGLVNFLTLEKKGMGS